MENLCPSKSFLSCLESPFEQTPTHKNLQKRGMMILSRCSYANTTRKMLTMCLPPTLYACTLWTWLWNLFSIHSTLPLSFNELWNLACKVRMSSQLFNLWISGCLITFHLIWESMNRAIFDNIKPIISRTMLHLKG